MGRRRYISWKTKCAAALLSTFQCRNMYDDAKRMTEDQFLSLFNWDHNILHESEHENRDKFWNLTPMLIKAHRQKTLTDAKIIAKSRRIRAWNSAAPASTLRTGPGETVHLPVTPLAVASRPARTFKRKLRSRGFDKRLRKKMDGTVVKR